MSFVRPVVDGVNWVRPDPSGRTSQIFQSPDLNDSNAIHDPVGDQAGFRPSAIGRSAPSTVETAQGSGRSRQSVQKATSRPSGPYDDPATMAPDGGLVLNATRTDPSKTIAPASTTAASTASRGLGRKLTRPLLSP